MRGRASSRPRWNSSPSAKTWDCRSPIGIARFQSTTTSATISDKQHAGSAQLRRISSHIRSSQSSAVSRSASRPRSPPSSCAHEVAAGRAIIPAQHQSPRARADDHRPQLPREDQRQHRQQRRRVEHRGGSREDALGHQVGRRHRHGPFHRQEHPRHARMDPPQLARAHRHRADLSGARKSGRQGRGTHLGNLTATPSSSRPSKASITSPSTPACCCASSRSPPTA